MRSYRRNTREAATRIVCLALVADGHFSCDELDRGEALEEAENRIIRAAVARWGSAARTRPAARRSRRG